MKIILLKDVPLLGKKDDICEVKPGYGLNFLIPQKLAKIADKSLIIQTQCKKETDHIKQKKGEDKLSRQAVLLKKAEVVIYAKINEKGVLFGAVSSADISKAIKKNLGLDISAKSIKIEKPIKEIGQYIVEVNLGKNLREQVSVTVAAEDERI